MYYKKIKLFIYISNKHSIVPIYYYLLISLFHYDKNNTDYVKSNVKYKYITIQLFLYITMQLFLLLGDLGDEPFGAELEAVGVLLPAVTPPVVLERFLNKIIL